MPATRGLPSDRHRARAVALASIAAFLLPTLVAAHPLGNFTINHYAGLWIEPDAVLLDVVIDQAEIPAFEARQVLDTNLSIACGQGVIMPRRVQRSGRGVMSTGELLRGFAIPPGTQLA